jgi:hypothetical protein
MYNRRHGRRDCWTRQLREAEAELAAAKRLTELNVAAKKLQLAKAALSASRLNRPLAVVRAPRALPHNLLGFVDFETRLLEMLDHPRG